MTRDDHRKKCIYAVREAIRSAPLWLKLCVVFLDGPYWWNKIATRAFDALNGVAWVVPIEATDELVESVAHDSLLRGYRNLWRAIFSTGDLTNKPEKKL